MMQIIWQLKIEPDIINASVIRLLDLIHGMQRQDELEKLKGKKP